MVLGFNVVNANLTMKEFYLIVQTAGTSVMSVAFEWREVQVGGHGKHAKCV